MLPSAKQIKGPLHAFLKRKGEVSMQEALDHIAKHFKVPKAKRSVKQGCGKETVLQNRLRWARWELQQEGKAVTTKRGYFSTPGGFREVK